MGVRFFFTVDFFRFDNSSIWRSGDSRGVVCVRLVFGEGGFGIKVV